MKFKKRQTIEALFLYGLFLLGYWAGSEGWTNLAYLAGAIILVFMWMSPSKPERQLLYQS
jgi:hypothetical protein